MRNNRITLHSDFKQLKSMEKPKFKKYTKEEAIKAARKMITTKNDWCECVRSGRPMSTLTQKGVKLVSIS